MISTLLMSFNWHNLIDPVFYINHGGLWVLLFIIFAETGLFVGFFLPGDSLLFVAGIYSDQLIRYTGTPFINMVVLIAFISVAGILGNSFGYFFGRKVGPSIYHWKENFIFKHHHLEQAHEFYEKHGVLAIVFARFIPIVRTFAPIVAGIVKMDKQKFSINNIAGCIAWATSMVAGGHYLYRFFLHHYNFDLTKHLEVIVLGIIFMTTAPVIFKIVFRKKKTIS